MLEGPVEWWRGYSHRLLHPAYPEISVLLMKNLDLSEWNSSLLEIYFKALQMQLVGQVNSTNYLWESCFDYLEKCFKGITLFVSTSRSAIYILSLMPIDQSKPNTSCWFSTSSYFVCCFYSCCFSICHLVHGNEVSLMPRLFMYVKKIFSALVMWK